MEKIKVSQLIPHPRNHEFFDDIEGEGWDDFLKSIRTSGVTNAITVDQRNIIISGHQRVRACELLGIDEIPANRITYTEEELNAEKDVKDLIESNLKQRVAGNANAVKLGRCFVFLEQYYGVKRGRPSKISNNVGNLKEDSTNGKKYSQDDMIRELGLNKETYRQAKLLATMPTEVQQAVEDGQISASTAVRTIAKLPKEKQLEIADLLSDGEKRFTESEVRQLIKEHTTQENLRLEAKIKELESQEPEVREIVKEVVPQAVLERANRLEEDYESLKRDLERTERERKQYLDKANASAKRLKELEGRSAKEELHDKAIQESEYFVAVVYNFIQKIGGYVWLKDYLSDIPKKKLREYKNALFELDSMTKIMIENAGGYE